MNFLELCWRFILGVGVGVFLISHIGFTDVQRVDVLAPYDELKNTISEFFAEKLTLEEEVATLRNEVKNLENSALVAESDLEKLYRLKRTLGLTEEHGEGVRITFDDRSRNISDPEEKPCRASDIRDIVNVLRYAGADAISVNGQRVIVSTTSACTERGVLINNTPITNPYILSVIGPYKELNNYLTTFKYLPHIHSEREDGTVLFDIQHVDDLVIAEYKGDITNKIRRKTKQ